MSKSDSLSPGLGCLPCCDVVHVMVDERCERVLGKRIQVRSARLAARMSWPKQVQEILPPVDDKASSFCFYAKNDPTRWRRCESMVRPTRQVRG
jgi:hypothetical protein